MRLESTSWEHVQPFTELVSIRLPNHQDLADSGNLHFGLIGFPRLQYSNNSSMQALCRAAVFVWRAADQSHSNIHRSHSGETL